MWCGKYYFAAEEESFPLTKLQEEEGFDLTQSEDRLRHLCARVGDHLLVPFQCDLCHFRNLTDRDPGQSVEDVRLIVAIRRANLDAFWAREPGTVAATKREGVKIGRLGALVGLVNLFPAMGPFPLEDTQGMGIAVCMLERSLDKGRYRTTLQFETVRKLRSAFSNIWHASRQTLTTSVMAIGISRKLTLRLAPPTVCGSKDL